MLKKLGFFIFFCSCASIVIAQENDIQKFHLQLQKETSNKELRYQLLDTLAILTEDANFHPLYEEVATECVQLGLQLKKYERTAYQTISVLYFYNNILSRPEKGIPYADAILTFEDSIPSFFKRGMLYQYRGDAHYFSSQIENAIEDYNKAEYFFESAPAEYDRMIALTRSYRAAAYAKTGAFVKATTDLQNALEYLEATTDTFNIIASRNELSMLFSKYEFYEKASEQRQEILKLNASSNAQLASIYVNIANDAYAQNQFEDYEKNMLQALVFARDSNRRSFSEPIILLSLAEKYYQKGEIESAQKFEQQYVEKYPEKTDFTKASFRQLQIAKYLSSNNYEQAKDSLEAHLAYLKSTKDVQSIYKTQAKLAGVYQSLKNYNKAYQLQNESMRLKDSVETDKKLKSLAYYQTQFETERKDRKIAETQASLDLVNLQSRNNKRIFYISLLSLLMASIAFFVYRNRLQLKKEETLQRQFAQDLIQAQDKEREMIAGNLHDSLGQSLVLLKKQARKSNQTDLIESTSYAIEELREISRNIYPPVLKKLGLSYTLEQLSKQVFETTAIQFDLALANIEDVISPKETLNLYRFIQEALSNTLKHAEATQISISIKRLENKIEVEVHDNGKGFDVEDKLNRSQSLGLLTLRHRIEAMRGTFTIKSNSNGTQVIGLIPFTENKQA